MREGGQVSNLPLREGEGEKSSAAEVFGGAVV